MGYLVRMQTLPTLPSSSLDILDLSLKLIHKVAYGTATGHDKVHLLYSTSTSIQGCYTCTVHKCAVLPYTNQKPCPNNSHWRVTQPAFWPSLGTVKTKVR